ncbi:uncharacterized protein [Haliotis asinina]|uniref:uncharacterized protein n=1 Tax=Haliotis asinina TaxID=109174 RepID=UPI00353198B7
MTSDCVFCAQYSLSTKLKEKLRLTIDIPLELVSKPNPKRDKKTFKCDRSDITGQFFKQVSALRNSGGGALFVHIGGLDYADRNLHYFHELFDKPLNDLVDEGDLFIDTFTFLWLKDLETVENKSHEFLIIVVRASSRLSTPDYKTKVSTDHEITQPSGRTLCELLLKTRDIAKEDTVHEIDALPAEGRSVQFKYVKSEFEKIHASNIDDFVTYMWVSLRLREYITALSKNLNGGSYFVGIEETDNKFSNYVSKTFQRKGIQILPECKPLIQRELDAKITNCIKVYPDKGTPLIKCNFHNLQDENVYVIEVAVRPISGCVFYDRDGPEAYELKNKSVERISFPVWLTKCTNVQ